MAKKTLILNTLVYKSLGDKMNIADTIDLIDALPQKHRNRLWELNKTKWLKLASIKMFASFSKAYQDMHRLSCIDLDLPGIQEEGIISGTLKTEKYYYIMSFCEDHILCVRRDNKNNCLVYIEKDPINIVKLIY